MRLAGLDGAQAYGESASAGRMLNLNDGETLGMQRTFDPTKDPIDLLPLRPWEVAKMRKRLAEMQGEPPARHGKRGLSQARHRGLPCCARGVRRDAVAGAISSALKATTEGHPLTPLKDRG